MKNPGKERGSGRLSGAKNGEKRSQVNTKTVRSGEEKIGSPPELLESRRPALRDASVCHITSARNNLTSPTRQRGRSDLLACASGLWGAARAANLRNGHPGSEAEITRAS